MARVMSEQLAVARTTYLVRRNSYPNGTLYNDGDWEGGCAAHRYVVGGYPDYYGSAYAAYLAAKAVGPLDLDPTTARAGEEHYWSGVIVAGREAGHIAGETGGNVLEMASSSVTTNWGHNSGLVSFADYKRKHPTFKYLGHAPRFGKWPAAVTSTTDLNSTPLSQRKRNHMILFHTPNADPKTVKTYPYIYHLLTESGIVYDFQSGSSFANLVAGIVGNSIPTDDAFIVAMKTQATAQVKALGLGAAVDVGSVTVDTSKLEAKLDALLAAVNAPATLTKAAQVDD